MYEEYFVISCDNDLASRVETSLRNSLSVRDDGTHGNCDE